MGSAGAIVRRAGAADGRTEVLRQRQWEGWDKSDPCRAQRQERGMQWSIDCLGNGQERAGTGLGRPVERAVLLARAGLTCGYLLGIKRGRLGDCCAAGAGT